MTTAAATAARRADRARLDASTELRLALARYERLSGAPRHLALPAVGCGIDQLIRSQRAAAARGNSARALELAALAAQETERQRLVRLWRTGRRHRSSRAWCAIAHRLEAAIYAAINAGILTGDRVQYCIDRQLDARHQFDMARHREDIARAELAAGN